MVAANNSFCSGSKVYYIYYDIVKILPCYVPQVFCQTFCHNMNSNQIMGVIENCGIVDWNCAMLGFEGYYIIL